MAFHHIQCPNCFTDYTVSDEKYHATEGLIRCGTCREQFTAMVITEDSVAARFDPREVFIEPFSSPLSASDGGEASGSDEPEPSYVSYEKCADSDQQDIELMSSHDFEYTGPKEPDVPKELIEEYAHSDELSTREILNNLRNRQPQTTPSSANSDSYVDGYNDGEAAQLDLGLASVNDVDIVNHATDEVSAQSHSEQNEALIDRVEQLVNEKVVNSETTDTPLTPASPAIAIKSIEDDFFLEPKPLGRQRKGGFGGALITLFMFCLILALAVTLAYQLWLKQWIELPHKHPWLAHAQTFVEPYWQRAESHLSELGIELPKRQNLSQLELVSARTEPHPTRSNTVLLKVSLINRATITQALPWLEMSLTDADGRLVARRNLSPEDYIYNNRTQADIGPNELKKITVELLSFPKSATGYEIKLLSQ